MGIDWVLMNPPYSRSSGKHPAFDISGVDEATRKAIQERWGKLISNEPCVKTAGTAASFLCLAHKRLRKEGGGNRGGRIGFVLPLTAALGESWTKTREMVELGFTDIIAIATAAGAASRGDAMSADTKIEEMLLVATHRTGGDKTTTRINCVTLHEPVTRMGEAREIGRLISESVRTGDAPSTHRPFFVGETEAGNVYVMDKQANGSPWSALGAVHGDLARVAENLALGCFDFLSEKHKIPLRMITIKELFKDGGTHHIIGQKPTSAADTGAFEMFEVRDKNDAIGKDRSLWAANCKTQITLTVLPTHKGVERPGKDHDATRTGMGRLFYARNMRWTSQALLSACTEREVMGGRAWTSLLHDDSRICKAFVLWANSIFGFLVHWTQGQRTQSGRATTQIGAIRKMPCPDFEGLSPTALDRAAEVFDELNGEQLKPALYAQDDTVRHRIDAVVIEFMGMSWVTPGDLDNLRRLWQAEPSVHGNKK